MTPDPHEWLRAEQQRIEAEGTGPGLRKMLGEYAKQLLGIWLIGLPAIYLIGILPRRIDGLTQSATLFALGVAITVLGVMLWRWKRPMTTIWRWGTWTLCGVGILYCLLASTK